MIETRIMEGETLVEQFDSLVEAKLALARMEREGRTGFTLDYRASTFDALSGEETDADGYQLLVETGDAWRLEGFIGRTAMGLIEEGTIMLGEHSCRDYWGSTVPARGQVEEGTKGSALFVEDARERSL